MVRRLALLLLLLLLCATPAAAQQYGPVIFTTGACLSGGPMPPTPKTIVGSFPLNAQSGATYTVASADRCTLTKLTNATAVAVTIPAALPAGWMAFYESRGAGGVTFTPASGTIEGLSSFQINQNNGIAIFSDGTNYHVWGTVVGGSASVTISLTCPQVSDSACLSVVDQVVSGGANVNPTVNGNHGTVSSGTVTIDCGQVQLQYVTNNGAFTLAAPSNDGNCLLKVTNSSGAGTITFSGFSVGSNTGDAIDTTNGDKFSLFIWRINGTAGYRVAAHQ